MQSAKDVLSGQLAYLRKLEAEDLDRTWRWLHRPDVYRKIGVQVPISKSDQQQWFSRLTNSKNKLVFAICVRETDDHIGNVSIDMIDWRHRNARFSIFLGDESSRGAGYGSDAIRTLINYAFEFLNLHKIWCKTDDSDPAVLRFYEKLGFRREGTLIQHEFHEGEYVNKVMLAIVRGITMPQ
jgi:RimJ/RimL family protein N-acetyltransferase